MAREHGECKEVPKNHLWREAELRVGSQRGKGLTKDDPMSSFFFTKFSFFRGAKEMFEIFKEHGMVVEVVIPPRRDKRGKIYGFVRFIKVVDARILAVKLDNIFIQGKKIYANIPRFQRGRNVDQQLEKSYFNVADQGWVGGFQQPESHACNSKVNILHKSYAQEVRVNNPEVEVKTKGGSKCGV
ncbi:unnamed protein product [Lathyrus oleraceus]